MLKNGKYIKSKKPQIGIYYVEPIRWKDKTPEEMLMWRANLGIKFSFKETFYNILSRALKI